MKWAINCKNESWETLYWYTNSEAHHTLSQMLLLHIQILFTWPRHPSHQILWMLTTNSYSCLYSWKNCPCPTRAFSWEVMHSIRISLWLMGVKCLVPLSQSQTILWFDLCSIHPSPISSTEDQVRARLRTWEHSFAHFFPLSLSCFPFFLEVLSLKAFT